jgi:DNA repair protein RadD
LELRPYQRQALNQLNEWFLRHQDGNCIVSACVGAGKSVLIATLAREALTQWPGTRILMVVASRELCAQNMEKLLRVWPDAPAGIHSAGLGRKDLGHDILYGTIGSLYKKAHLLGRVDLMLIDECHQIGASEDGMYRKLIAELQRYNPGMRVIGWTGTAYRGDGVWLTDQEQPLFHGIAARVEMRDLIDQGFLSPLVEAKTTLHMDASGVAMRAGDYVAQALAAKINTPELVAQACDELVRLAADRKRWLVYGVTVKHALHIADALKERGIACGVVHAQTPAGERDALLKMLHGGQIRALVNVATLTTGIDIPELDCIALMRNTRSPVLYTQIAGRGMRTAPGKENCSWLDFTDTTAILGPVDAIKGRARPRSKKEEREAPTKVCDECGSINAAGRRTCIDCEHEFPEPQRVSHDTRVNGAAVMSGNSKIRSFSVDDVTYCEHRKEGKPPSVRVEYWYGPRKVSSEWLCFEHDARYARGKAAWTWREMGGQEPVPSTVEEALSRTDELKRVNKVLVDQSGEFWEVVGREYAGTSDSGEDVQGSTGSAAEEGVRDVLPF